MLDLVADRLDHLPGPVRDALLDPSLTHAGRKPRYVAMAARDAERAPRRHDPRPDDVATLHRVSQLDRDVASVVAHGGESRTHGAPAEDDRVEGAPGLRARDRIGERGRADLHAQVRVRIDEPGQQRHVAQVHVVHRVGDGLGVHSRDDPVLDDEHRVRVHLAGLDIEHPRRAQHGGAVVHAVMFLRGDGVGGREGGGGHEGDGQCDGRRDSHACAPAGCG